MRRTALRATGSVAFVALLAAALAANAESAKRPVTVPGSTPPAPPPVVETAPPAQPAPAPAEAAAAPAPADPAGKVIEQVVVPEAKPAPAPAAPSVFKDERAPAAAPAAARAVDPDPRELRYRKKSGDVLLAMVVRPGKPKPAMPTEIVFQVEELLPIPDPALGDRRPLEKAKLVAKVSGPDGARTFELHPLAAKGHYGFHFTPGAVGLYNVVCERVSGRPVIRADFTLGVGVETPIPTDDSADPNLRKGPRSARNVLGGESRRDEVKGPDDSTAAGVMDELGKEWMTLRRVAGTADAAAPMAKVLDQAKKLPGKVPPTFPESRAEFDRLAAKFVADLEALQGKVADPAAASAELDRLQNGTCLRCHAQFRFGVAQSVERWPDFEKRQAPAAQPAAGKKEAKRKLPVAMPGKE